MLLRVRPPVRRRVRPQQTTTNHCRPASRSLGLTSQIPWGPRPIFRPTTSFQLTFQQCRYYNKSYSSSAQRYAAANQAINQAQPKRPNDPQKELRLQQLKDKVDSSPDSIPLTNIIEFINNCEFYEYTLGLDVRSPLCFVL